MIHRLFDFFLAAFVAGLYSLWSRFWRITHIRQPERVTTLDSYIGGHWHGDELLLLKIFANQNMAVLSSQSRDGERMARVLRWLGYQVTRGSSHRGGALGLKGLIEVVLKTNCSASLAVDGPRGPRYQVKPGILKLAQQTNRPIILGAASSQKKIVFKKSWNQCYLPLPFTQCVVVYSSPIWVAPDLNAEDFEERRCELERELLRLKEEAEAYFHRGAVSEMAGCSAGG